VLTPVASEKHDDGEKHDGEKHDGYQEMAAAAAASLCHYVLSDKNSLNGL
jgi:hypothetical protein